MPPFRRRPRPAPAPRFAFCEPVTAVAAGLEHIRAVGPEGVKGGGGIPVPALCGRDVVGGWDIPGRDVNVATVALLAEPDESGVPALCRRCADLWAAQQGTASVDAPRG